MNPFDPTAGGLFNFLTWLVNVLIFAAGIGVVFFAVSYAVFFNWRKTQSGRSLMYFVLSLVAVFGLVITGTLTNSQYFGRAWIRVAIYAAIAGTVWNLGYQLWSNYRSGSVRLLDIDRRESNLANFERTIQKEKKK